jgi:hypothetical protein
MSEKIIKMKTYHELRNEIKCNDDDLLNKYGREQKGQRCIVNQIKIGGLFFSIFASMTTNGFKCWQINEKIHNSSDFISYVTDILSPAIDPNNVGGGGGGGFFAMSSGGMVPRYMASGGLAGYKPAREKIPMQMSYGGMVPKYFAVGGMSIGTDIIPAMLTPGEFVMTKYAVDSYGVDKMKAINSGSYDGEKVYNYNLNVNVKSDANPEDIARVVMTQIRQVDSQRIRAQRG